MHPCLLRSHAPPKRYGAIPLVVRRCFPPKFVFAESQVVSGSSLCDAFIAHFEGVQFVL